MPVTSPEALTSPDGKPRRGIPHGRRGRCGRAPRTAWHQCQLRPPRPAPHCRRTQSRRQSIRCDAGPAVLPSGIVPAHARGSLAGDRRREQNQACSCWQRLSARRSARHRAGVSAPRPLREQDTGHHRVTCSYGLAGKDLDGAPGSPGQARPARADTRPESISCTMNCAGTPPLARGARSAADGPARSPPDPIRRPARLQFSRSGATQFVRVAGQGLQNRPGRRRADAAPEPRGRPDNLPTTRPGTTPGTLRSATAEPSEEDTATRQPQPTGPAGTSDESRHAASTRPRHPVPRRARCRRHLRTAAYPLTSMRGMRRTAAA